MGTKCTILTIAASIAVSVSVQTAAHAKTWNVVTDYSNAHNPSGQWSYGYGTGGSSFNLFTENVADVFGYGWKSPTVFGEAGVNTLGYPVNAGTGTYPPGDIYMHPGPSTDTITQWTAPTAGTYTYSGTFALLDRSPSGIIGEVFEDSTSLYSGTLTGPGADQATYTPGGSESFSGTVALGAGDTLSFVVNNDGNYSNDSTALTAIITSVPEPSTWAMMILGFAGIGGMMRRRGARTRHPSPSLASTF